MNDLGVTLVIAIGLNYDLSPTVFNIFGHGVKARITNSRAESKWTPKDFLTSVNTNALRESPGGGVLPYMGYIGMCGPKGYGFSAVLVMNWVSILAILPPLWS